LRRLLGVDLGERRIGLAVADLDGGRALPLTTISRAPTPTQDAQALATIATEQDAIELVVGLPIEASGAEGTQARLTRSWADEVGRRLGMPIALRDERLTSHLAEGRVGPMKRGRSGGPPTRMQRQRYRARIDREAAAIILQDELDARARGERLLRPGVEAPRDDARDESRDDPPMETRA
jgi:putative Holliday junction resolvase